MPPSPRDPHPHINRHLAGWMAIVSGVVGLAAFLCLMAYLTSPTLRMQDSGYTPPAGVIALRSDFLGAMLQALCLIPVAAYLHRTCQPYPFGPGRPLWILALVALVAVAILRVVPLLQSAVSDILFMAPMGLIGVWLLAVNSRKGYVPHGLPLLGIPAGIGLTLVGLNFFFNGGLAVLTQGPFAYASNIPFHIGLAIGGLPGFLFLPAWSFCLGIHLLRSSNQPSALPSTS